MEIIRGWSAGLLIGCLLTFLPGAMGGTLHKFDFDTPPVAGGTSAPFDLTVGGLTARFGAPLSGLGFFVTNQAQNGWNLPQFSENYLASANIGRPVLTIEFSRPLLGISMTFSTYDTHQNEVPTLLKLDAFLNSAPVGTSQARAVYGTAFLPEGSLAYSGGSFDRIELNLVYEVNMGVGYAVDYILAEATDPQVVAVVPEPASGMLLCAGLLLACVRRRCFGV